MLESFPVLLAVGTLLGFLTGLGVGGGSLLILWLTMVLKLEPEAARSLNLLFFLPSALVSTLFRYKGGNIRLQTAVPAIVAGCISTILFSLIGRNIHTELLKKMFGGLLILTGIRELFYNFRLSGHTRKNKQEENP